MQTIRAAAARRKSLSRLAGLLAGAVLTTTWPAASCSAAATGPSTHGVFIEPLAAAAAATPGDEAALDAAIAAYRQGAEAAAGDPDAYGRVEPLLAYLRGNPVSPWRVSLLANIALRYEQLGYVQRALDFDEQAVAAASGARGAVAAQADMAFADELELRAWLGHAEAARALLADPRVATLQGAAHVKAVDARLALQQLESDPSQARRCGWVALEHLLRLRGASRAQLAALEARRAGPRGTSLTELAAWADEHQAGLKPLRIAPGREIPVPAVVHMKTGHFAMAAEARGSGAGRQIHLVDPVLGDDRWVSARAVAAESSGHVLADARVAGPVVTTAEAARVVGAGNPSKGFNGATSAQDNQSGGDCAGQGAGASGFDGSAETQGSGPPDGSGDGSACDGCSAPCAGPATGMPGYSVQALNVGLALHDTPFVRSTAVGPAVAFSVYYSQNEVHQPATFTFSNLGQKWTHNWLAYVTDDPTAVGRNVSLYKRTGGYVTYSGYSAADGSFTRETRSEQLVLASSSPVKYVRRFADGSQEVYSASDGTSAPGRRVFLTKVVDANGNAVILAYDSLMRLTTITDAAQVATSLGYASATSLAITSVSDSLGRHADFGYDANGRLQSISDTTRMSSSFGYDANGNVSSMTTPYGLTKFNFQVVSPVNRWIEITDPLGHTERVEYESTGNNGIAYTGPTPAHMNVAAFDLNYRDTFWFDKVAYVAAKRADGTFDYNQATVIKHWAETNPGNAIVAPVLLATRHPMNSNTEWEWYLYPDMVDANGAYSPKTVTDIWTMTSSGRVLPDGTSRVTQVAYNPQGHVTTKTDPLGRTTTFQYDTNGIDLLKVTQSDGAGHSEVIYQASNYTSGHQPQTVVDAAGQATNFTYNGLGQVVTITNALQQVVTYNYNALHQLINIVNANQVKQLKLDYDGFGRVQVVTDSEGYARTYAYDNLDRVTSVTYPDGTTDITNYDRLDIGSTVDRLGHKTVFTHDAQRRLTQVLDVNGVNTYYGWYDNDRLHTFKDGRGKVTTWVVDAEGRVQQKSYPSGQGYTLAYDSAGRESTRADTNGHVRTITYNKDDTVASLAYTGGNTDTQTFIYDTLYPRILSTTDQQTAVKTSFAYVPAGANGAGQLQSETSSFTSGPLPVSYAYDVLGRLQKRTVGANVESWGYDALGRVQTDANALGSFGYNYLGQTNQPLTEVLAGARWQTQWTWNTNLNDRMLQAITHPVTAAGVGADGMGWFTRMAQRMGLSIAHPVPPHARVFATAAGISYTTQTGQITGRSAGADSWVYAYDKTNRLKSATYGGTGTGQGAQYTYDAADNLTQVATTNPATTENYVPNQDNQVASTNGTVAATWIYDADGNVTDDGVNTYAWDAENRPVKITNKATGHVSSFNYDGLGRRLSFAERDTGGKTVTTWLSWCQGVPAPCAATTSANTATYFAQGETNTGLAPANRYYARDHLGSVVQTVDANGNVLAGRTYGEYGKTYNASGTATPAMGFAGMYQHAQSGLYLTPNRAYDARDGRWLSRDPIEELGGSNVYAYGLDNPVGGIDPSGRAVFYFGWGASATAGVGTISAGRGIVVDTKGNVGTYSVYGAGAGAGGDVAGGLSFGGMGNVAAGSSRVTTISDFGGPFLQVSAGAGLGPHGTIEGFIDPANTDDVGFGLTFGPGAGGGGSLQVTNTVVTPTTWSNLLQSLLPGAIRRCLHGL